MSIGVVAGWVSRLVLAAYFLYVGSRKFAPTGMWVNIFAQMGAPQWFRYLTGILQIIGAVLLLIPRTVLIGVWLIGCTMVGAMITWIFVLRAPFSALLPAILLTMLVSCAWQHVRAVR
jgi:putative oxidoreductase